MKLKVTSKQEQQNSQTDNSPVVPRGKRGRGQWRVKGVKHMLAEDDLTLAGERTVQYTDDVL